MSNSAAAQHLRYIGLAAGAGELVCGTEQVLRALRSGRVGLVVLSCDASERTVKQISDKCAYYKTELIHLADDMYTLAHTAGKTAPTAAAAVMNKSLAEAAKAALGNK